MIEVTAAVLHALKKFADIRRPPRKSDGNRHLCRFSRIHYGGDSFLSLQTTDGRTTLISRFPVLGAAAPWTATVDNRQLPFLDYIEGRRRQVGLISEHVLAIDSDPSHCRLRNYGVMPSFPEVERPHETYARVTLAPDVLAAPLATLAGGQSHTNLDDAATTCSWHTDGLAVASHRRVDLAADLPALPFAVHLRKQDCFLFASWLKLVQGYGNVQLCCVNAGDCTSYCCQTADGLHALWLTAATRTFPRELLDQPRSEVPAAIIQIERERLRINALLFGGIKAHKRLVCEFLYDARALHIYPKRSSRDEGLDKVPAEFHIYPIGGASIDPFEVEARALSDTLGKFTDENVCLIYRIAQRRLSVIPAESVEFFVRPKLEAIIRTSPFIPAGQLAVAPMDSVEG